MEREPYHEDEITKTGELSSRTTKKLESSKEVNRNGKSHKKQFDKKRKNPQGLNVGNNM